MAKKKTASTQDQLMSYIRLNESKTEIHEWIAFILLMIMAVQPLQGITSIAYTNNEVIDLFEGRAVLIRAVGYASLLNALVFYVRRIFTEGTGILKDTFLRRPWNSFLLLLLIWSFVCVGHAAEREVAIGGDPVRFEGILSYIAYAGFFAGASLVKDEKHKRILFITMGLTATVLGGLSLWCLYNPSPVFLSYMNVNVIAGLSGTFVNTNHYGYYLCTMSTVLFTLAVLAEKKWLKLVFALLGAYQCLVLLFNNTLGSVMAAILGLCVMLLLFALRKGGKTRMFTLVSFALVLVCAAGFVAYCVKNEDANQLTKDVVVMTQDLSSVLKGGDADNDDAGSGRWGIWKNCIEHIKDHPVMGCGTDNAYYALTPYYGSEKMPHNEYLNMGVNLGLPGMLLYLAALISLVISRLIKLRRLPDITLMAGCCAFTYAVSAFFGVPLCTMLPFFYIFLSLFADDAGVLERGAGSPAVKAGPQTEAKAEKKTVRKKKS